MPRRHRSPRRSSCSSSAGREDPRRRPEPDPVAQHAPRLARAAGRHHRPARPRHDRPAPPARLRIGAWSRTPSSSARSEVARARAAPRAGGDAHRASRDPQPRHARRQPGARRSGGRISGLRARARRDADPRRRERRTARAGARPFFKGLFETDLTPGRDARRGRVPARPSVGVPRARAAPWRLRHRRPRRRRRRRRASASPSSAPAATPVLARTRLARSLRSRRRSQRSRQDLNPPADLYNSPATKLHLAGVLLARAWNYARRNHTDASTAQRVTRRDRAAHAPGRLPARGARPDRLAYRLRARRVRRLHRARRTATSCAAA